MKMDARRLVHELGGQAELQRRLGDIGHRITTDGIEKWCVRGSVPTEWMMRLNEIQPINLADYKIKPKKMRKS